MPQTLAKTGNESIYRLQFFDFIFADESGHLCIAVGNRYKTYFQQHWFKWPAERLEIGKFLESKDNKFNLWYGISLFDRPERKRDYAVAGKRVWADFDEVNPQELEQSPGVIVESSPGRFQGMWMLDTEVPPDVAQEWSRKAAYETGADRSGWDLEQLLRIPFTYNYKYDVPAEVKVIRLINITQNTEYFEQMPNPSNNRTIHTIEIEELPRELPDLNTILYHYHKDLQNPLNLHNSAAFIDLREREPADGEDWSARLWRLINICFEMGMSDVEVYVVADSAACNKYHRDNRPMSYMWREIQKAKEKHNKFLALVGATEQVKLTMPILVDPSDVTEDSFVAEYKAWANEATDAPEQYHEVSCFIALSSVISNGLSLVLPYDSNFRPNLWALVLGDSTLSRKTTSMRMALNLITDLDPELLLASDGSAEGLLTGLSGRPKRVSIFYKDEVSGFFDSINRKDYLAGFPETLTQLYDVPKVLSRLLRKETITVTEPYFIFFGGGIREKVYNLISDDYILSGFLPRFIIVSSDNDISRIRRTGPPSLITSDKKERLIGRLADLKERYGVQVPVRLGTQSIMIDGRIEAKLTDEAWNFFGDKEEQLQRAAFESPWQMLALPTMTRMAFSMLKISMLIAASRKEVSSANTIEVELSDLKQAAYYTQKWGQHSLDLIMASGRTSQEHNLERVLTYVKAHPEGVVQTRILQRFHMSSREWRDLKDTLADRGLISIQSKGRGLLIKALEF